MLFLGFHMVSVNYRGCWQDFTLIFLLRFHGNTDVNSEAAAIRDNQKLKSHRDIQPDCTQSTGDTDTVQESAGRSTRL